jgi:hypothetical protein
MFEPRGISLIPECVIILIVADAQETQTETFGDTKYLAPFGHLQEARHALQESWAITKIMIVPIYKLFLTFLPHHPIHYSSSDCTHPLTYEQVERTSLSPRRCPQPFHEQNNTIDHS